LSSPDTKLYNPYLAARRDWDERYGNLITRAKNWRLMALVSGVVALAAVIGNGRSRDPLAHYSLRRCHRLARSAGCHGRR